MKIIFLNRFFYPDHSATSQILSDLAFYLAGHGEKVCVITSRQLYDDSDATLLAREEVGGIAVRRIATTRFGRNSLLGRAIDYLSFFTAAGWALLRIARRGDIVVAKTDPPMLSVLTAALAPFISFKTVNWLQDLYPEVAVELGVPGLKGIVGRFLIALRNASLRCASTNVAVGKDMAERLCGAGLSSQTLDVIPNWADDDAIIPLDGESNPLRLAWSLEGKFVVAYSGNLGRAHDIETLIGAAVLLRPRSDIVFLFIGGGGRFTELEMEVRNLGLTNFMFKPYQSRQNIRRSLGVADIHWLSIKTGLDGLILPSKFYGIAAAGRPIIVVGSPDGELSKLVSSHACGFSVPSGGSGELARVIVALVENRDRCREMGMNARHMLDECFTKGQALEHWHTLLHRILADENPHV